jgi:CDP-paratose 2-epimerase
VDGRPPEVRVEAWRKGDPRYYVSDAWRFRAATGWEPRVDVAAGIRRLHEWMSLERAVRPEIGVAKAVAEGGR